MKAFKVLRSTCRFGETVRKNPLLRVSRAYRLKREVRLRKRYVFLIQIALNFKLGTRNSILEDVDA